MKHVFECGIVATANDAVGREFLVGMIDGEAYGHDWMSRRISGTRDDFTITVSARDFKSMSDYTIFEHKMKVFTEALIALGYTRYETRRPEDFDTRYRFKK